MQREQPEDEEAVWQDIVDNYGERVTLDPEETPAPAEEEPAPAVVEYVVRDEPHAELDEDETDRFVPEPPPRVPIAPPDRFLAWLGVFGSPAVFLVLLILGISPPSLVNWILVGGFVGGFGYLVFKLPRSPEDPWDDGARI